jgi:hypothetical protein
MITQQPLPKKGHGRLITKLIIAGIALVPLLVGMYISTVSTSPIKSVTEEHSLCQPLTKDQLAAIGGGLRHFGGKLTGESAWLPLPSELQTSGHTKIVAVGVTLGVDHETVILATDDDQEMIQDVNTIAFVLFDWGRVNKGTDTVGQLRESDVASEVSDCIG